MRLGRGALIVCLGIIISFIGLIVWNIPLGGSEESAVAVDWYGWIYFGWGIFGCFVLGPFVILYGIFYGFSSSPSVGIERTDR